MRYIGPMKGSSQLRHSQFAARGVASPSPSEPSLATMDMNHMMRWPKSPSRPILLSAFLLLPMPCYM